MHPFAFKGERLPSSTTGWRASLSDERLLLERALQRFGIRRPEDPALRDDAGDELVRCHVEGRIPDARAGRRELRRADVRHLAAVALFDRDAIAVRRIEVDRRARRRYVKRNLVLAGEDRHAVGADL